MIPIVFSSDDKYSRHLGVSLVSIFENKNKKTKIKTYILDGGISKENKLKLLKIAKNYNTKIIFIKIENEIINSLPVNYHITSPAYFRLLIPKIILENKIIYLDCDTIIKKDLTNLFNINLCNKAIGAVEALTKKENLKRKPWIGNIYINSGVMLIDCNRWNKINLTEKTIKFAKKNPTKLENVDQDAINYTCQKYIKTLDRKYNLEVKTEDKKTKIKHINIIIIHYIGSIKPWHFMYNGPLKEEYKKYLKKTPWKNNKYSDKNIKNIIKKIIFILFPKKIVKIIMQLTK